MSLPQSHLDWPTSVDPDLLLSIDAHDTWLFADDLALTNKDLYTSLPLSLIQQDKHIPFNNGSQHQHGLENHVVPGIVKTEVDLSPPYSPQRGYESDSSEKPSKAEFVSKLLDELDTCKDEPYAWMEEKIEFPAFGEVCEPIPQQVDNTQSLLLEFESVCQQSNYQLNHLTPPQSPPFHQQTQYGWTQLPPVNYQTPVQVPAATVPNWQPEILHLDQQPQIDVAHELAVVDAIVERRAQDIDGVYDSDLNSIPSPRSDSFILDYHSNSSSLLHQEDSCEQVLPIVLPAASEHAYAKPTEESLFQPDSPNSSSSCSVYGSSENDEEWAPSSASEAGSVGRPRKYTRTKPYSRNDDKKSRKKEQNKNAATRYRQKKKQEVEVLASEEKLLKDKNSELKSKCLEIQQEVKYLKKLMLELCKVRGLIK